MKKDEILYPPERVKVDTIADEEAYLKEKLKDRCAEYRLIMQSKKQPSKLYLVLYIVAILILTVGFVLIYTVKPKYIGLIIEFVGAVVCIVGVLLSPRKRHDVNPFEFKLAKPVSMEPMRQSKRNNTYWFIFDFTDKNGKSFNAITESKYSEEEKEKICKSFINGTVIVAVNNDWNAEILEF